MKAVIALLAFAACAQAGLIAGPALYDHHHHAHAVYAAPTIVKHVQPAIYAVPPPILAKPVVYAAPAVKVLHAPAVVKTVYHAPIAYHHDIHHHDLHHHHHHF